MYSPDRLLEGGAYNRYHTVDLLYQVLLGWCTDVARMRAQPSNPVAAGQLRQDLTVARACAQHLCTTLTVPGTVDLPYGSDYKHHPQVIDRGYT